MSVVIRAMRHTQDPDGYVYDLPKQIARRGWPLRGDKDATYRPAWSPDHGAHVIRKNEIRPLINLLSHAGIEYLYIDNPAWEPGGRFRPASQPIQWQDVAAGIPAPGGSDEGRVSAP